MKPRGFVVGNSRLRSLSAADQVGGKGAMDGAERLKGRPGVSKQDVCERRAKPAAPGGRT
jgi:hypothetical protein